MMIDDRRWLKMMMNIIMIDDRYWLMMIISIIMMIDDRWWLMMIIIGIRIIPIIMMMINDDGYNYYYDDYKYYCYDNRW